MDFPHQGPVMQKLDVFYIISLESFGTNSRVTEYLWRLNVY